LDEMERTDPAARQGLIEETEEQANIRKALIQIMAPDEDDSAQKDCSAEK
jgi:hypothetical protein